MSTEHRWRAAQLAALGLCLAACIDAGGAGGRSGAAVPSAVAPGGPAAPLPLQPTSDDGNCGLAGTVRDCDCGLAPGGKQTCLESGWGGCACSAAAAGIAGGGAAGAGGAAAPPVSVEPAIEDEPRTGVVFEWPETDPTDVAICEPGHYVGSFSCDLYIITNDGMPAFELSGTIDMQLEQTMDGELLRIANGQFVSAAAVAIPAWGDIVGELDCSSGRFDGRIENGRFSVALGIPVPFTEGIFEGELSADYDAEAAAMHDGAWDMIGNLDGFPGSCTNGTWSAMHVP